MINLDVPTSVSKLCCGGASGTYTGISLQSLQDKSSFNGFNLSRGRGLSIIRYLTLTGLPKIEVRERALLVASEPCEPTAVPVPELLVVFSIKRYSKINSFCKHAAKHACAEGTEASVPLKKTATGRKTLRASAVTTLQFAGSQLQCRRK